MNHSRVWRANGLLLLTAAIWGFGFVAQAFGASGIGPFSFNTLRFGLGSAALLVALPLIRRFTPAAPSSRRALAGAGLAVGLALFAGSSLQTAGLAFTLPGKAGFITGLYVVLVPLSGLLWGQKTRPLVWLGAGLGLAGLYLLSVTVDFSIQVGDLLILAGAFFWAAHLHLVGYFSQRVDPIRLSILQFVVTALLSLPAALFLEAPDVHALRDSVPAVLFGGLLSVGVAFTLQVIGQRDTHPGHAAVILVSEAVFAALGGWLLMGEQLGPRELAGCGLMLAGMLLAVAAPYLHGIPLSRNTADLAPE